MSQKTHNQSTVEYKKYIKWFWKLFIAGILFIILIFLLASWGVFGEMPDHTKLENPETNLATEIISSDGKTLGKFYFNDNRTPIGYDELPKHLVDALIATEDVRFYDHSGIDARGTLRAFVFLGKRGGASTITQQLARQLFIGIRSKKLDKYTQKIKEWIIATRLEKQYTKEEIIAQYFNIYDFDNNADGIRSAARIYFGKEPMDLNIQESAMLVGMFKNSSYFSPKKRPEKTKNRRNVVLAQMAKYDYITEKEKDSLQQIPLNLNFTPESHKAGTATYFREYLRAFMKKWINDQANRKPDGSKYNINSDGLKIFTTIDSRMQKYAEAAVKKHMPKLQAEFFHQNTPDRNKTAPFLGLTQDQIDDLMKRSMKRSERWRKMKKELKKSDKEITESFYKPTKMTIFSWQGEIDTIMKPIDSMRYYKTFLQTGMMAMEPQTGHIKVWIGGTNYKHFQYDHVKQSKRQVGSTFKPFVYALALDELHLSPCEKFPDKQYCIEKDKWGNNKEWCPKNSGGKYGDDRTLKSALANSINTITAQLMDKVGPKNVIDFTKKLGITTEIPELPSIALGSADLSVYEMVGAYSTFANKGVYTTPVMIERIEDKNGTVLYQYTPETKDVLSEEAAYTTVKLMQGVTDSGSGSRLKHSWAVNSTIYKEIITDYPYNFTNPIAGKTGTTQNQSDGWFMGMVPNLVAGVWVGAEDRATHFSRTAYGQGAAMALPIWAIFMKSCYADKSLNVSTSDFEKPENLSIEIDCEKFNKKNDSKSGDKEGIDQDENYDDLEL